MIHPLLRSEVSIIEWINSFGYSKHERSLEPIKTVLEVLGNPHEKLETIHVAGTNGKGSTVAFLRSILIHAGVRVGTFTSPFMVNFKDRIEINNTHISKDHLGKYARRLKAVLDHRENRDDLSSFDVLTLISFMYFADQKVDVVIYETGIGGRLDSTNVIRPMVTAITNVGDDHAEILGESPLERAMEKLGIVKEGVPLFTTEENPDLLTVFRNHCQGLNAPFHESLLGFDFVRTVETGTLFHYQSYRFVRLKMLGKYQAKNATLALSIAEYLMEAGIFDLDVDVIYKGLDVATWPGRFEFIEKKPPVIIDGAHNIDGLKALIDLIETVYPKRRKKFLFSALKHKDVNEMRKLLDSCAHEVHYTTWKHPNAIDPVELLSEPLDFPTQAEHVARPEYKKMLGQFIKKLEEDEVLIICGSLYFVSELRKFVLRGKELRRTRQEKE